MDVEKTQSLKSKESVTPESCNKEEHSTKDASKPEAAAPDYPTKDVEQTQSSSSKKSKKSRKKSRENVKSESGKKEELSTKNASKKAAAAQNKIAEVQKPINKSKSSTLLKSIQDVNELLQIDKTQEDVEIESNVEQQTNDPSKFPLPAVPASNDASGHNLPSKTKIPSIEKEAVTRFCCGKYHIKSGVFVAAILQSFIFFFGITLHLFALSSTAHTTEHPYVSLLALTYYSLQSIPLILLWFGIRSSKLNGSKFRPYFLVPYIIWSIFFIVGCFALVTFGIHELADPSMFGIIKFKEEKNDQGMIHNSVMYDYGKSYDMYREMLLWIIIVYYFLIPFLQIWCTFIIFNCYSYFSRLSEVSKPNYQKSDLHNSGTDRYQFCFGFMHIKSATIASGVLHSVLIINSMLINIGIADLDFDMGIIVAISLMSILFIPIIFLFIGLCNEITWCFLIYYACGYFEVTGWLIYMINYITLGWKGGDYHQSDYQSSYKLFFAWSIEIIIFSLIIQFRIWSNYISYKCMEYFGNVVAKRKNEIE